MNQVTSIDPRTGAVRAVLCPETSRTELDAICAQAAVAFSELRGQDRAWRASMLRKIADALEAVREPLVEIADAETALGAPRLNGELTRTCFQFRMFADAVAEGGYLEATIDHAGQTAMGPRPDLRRMLVPLGPVGVFGASNFPLAFSVPGGDTASALAAGCPVVAKAHESHPETSKLCAEVMDRAITEAGGPQGAVSVIYGRDPGGLLVQHPTITAVGFTGSARAAQALMQLIDDRPTPIPFYGELGSINPLVVTPVAAEERGDGIGRGLAGSMSLGVGQFCTKPGLAFVPVGDAGDQVVSAAAEEIRKSPAGVMLNANISAAFATGAEELASSSALRLVATGKTAEEGTQAVAPRLFEVDLEDLTGRMVEECFGPLTIVVRYSDLTELTELLSRLPASLTSTLQTGTEASTVEQQLLAVLQDKAGRVVFNGFPTGVAVSWAQTHGGGWPASNSLHTSVGVTAIRRFLRPLTWQDAPQSLVPVELREETRGVPRRVDGELFTDGG